MKYCGLCGTEEKSVSYPQFECGTRFTKPEMHVEVLRCARHCSFSVFCLASENTIVKM